MQTTTVVDYRSEILRGVQFTLGTLISKAYDSSNKSKDISDHITVRLCTKLYKEKSLLVDAPGIFGFVFAVILSLGHRSSVWTNDMTREDRRVLFAANSMFTCLRDHTDLGVGWLLQPTDMRDVIKDCPDCSKLKNTGFKAWWDSGFGQCGKLSSQIPLEDIRHIVRLPHYRNLFSDASSVRRYCGKGCPARLLAYIDEHMESLYHALTKKYQDLKETV
ncbi:unnamed protein product [Rhizoctonia solani]|uniref:Uncharacterized protein n=1 Tax=Rhizoctonia solani TaxID=456999 RepID=A0A8H3DW22_9AGAM|nr:unnamed protein product [Rhizoctonia solani]